MSKILLSIEAQKDRAFGSRLSFCLPAGLFNHFCNFAYDLKATRSEIARRILYIFLFPDYFSRAIKRYEYALKTEGKERTEKYLEETEGYLLQEARLVKSVLQEKIEEIDQLIESRTGK
jgi:hypothetical protein